MPSSIEGRNGLSPVPWPCQNQTTSFQPIWHHHDNTYCKKLRLKCIKPSSMVPVCAHSGCHQAHDKEREKPWDRMQHQNMDTLKRAHIDTSVRQVSHQLFWSASDEPHSAPCARRLSDFLCTGRLPPQPRPGAAAAPARAVRTRPALPPVHALALATAAGRRRRRTPAAPSRLRTPRASLPLLAQPAPSPHPAGRGCSSRMARRSPPVPLCMRTSRLSHTAGEGVQRQGRGGCVGEKICYSPAQSRRKRLRRTLLAVAAAARRPRPYAQAFSALATWLRRSPSPVKECVGEETKESPKRQLGKPPQAHPAGLGCSRKAQRLPLHLSPSLARPLLQLCCAAGPGRAWHRRCTAQPRPRRAAAAFCARLSAGCLRNWPAPAATCARNPDRSAARCCGPHTLWAAQAWPGQTGLSLLGALEG